MIPQIPGFGFGYVCIMMLVVRFAVRDNLISEIQLYPKAMNHHIGAC